MDATKFSWALQGDRIIWRQGDAVLPIAVVGIDRDHLAVQELTYHLGLITGVDWTDLRQERVANSVGIVLAKSDVLADEHTRIGLEHGSGTLRLEGGGDRGVLYAVYDLLEGFGVRWFQPGAVGLHATHVDALRVPSKLNRCGSPSIADRGLHICGYGKLKDGTPHEHYDDQTLRWMLRNRMNFKPVHNRQIDAVGPMLEQLHLKSLAFGHSYADWFNDDDFVRHPQYFAMVGGKRLRGGQLCLSNQAMRQQLVQRIVAFIDKHPHQSMISLAPNDGYKFCECDRCAEMDSAADRAGDNISRRHHGFSAEIARRVREQRGGVLISTLSYANYRDASPDIAPEPSLAISACIVRSLKHSIDDPASPTNRVIWDRVGKWVQKGGHVTFAEYYLSYGGLYPRAYEKATVATMRALRDGGVKGFKSEVLAGDSRQWHASVLLMYLLARYLWDADQPLAMVLDDFYSNYYGPASLPCRAIHERLSREVESYEGEICAMNALIVPDVFSEGDIAALTAWAAEAEQAAQMVGEPYVSRVGYLRDQCALIALSRREVVAAMAEPTWLAVPQVDGDKPLDTPAYRLRSRINMLPMEPRALMRLGYTGSALVIDVLVAEPARHGTLGLGGPVWGRSHVDLFFTGHRESEVYYQVAADYHGDVYTARCRKRSWDSDLSLPMDIHAQVMESRWRLRLHIPLASLGIDPASATSLWAGLNVSIQNDQGSSEYGGWPRGGAFHDVSQFGELRFECKDKQ